MTQESAVAEIKIGQPVVLSAIHGWPEFGYEVVRVTNTGQIVVSMTIGNVRRFDKNFKEIGGMATLHHLNIEELQQNGLQALVAELDSKLATAKEKFGLCASESQCLEK